MYFCPSYAFVIIYTVYIISSCKTLLATWAILSMNFEGPNRKNTSTHGLSKYTRTNVGQAMEGAGSAAMAEAKRQNILRTVAAVRHFAIRTAQEI